MKEAGWYAISVGIKMLLGEKVSPDEIKEKLVKIIEYLAKEGE